ncbi:MAG TPA: MBL fold metallo-hydrolase [Usitatibacteraceae bacterium]|nr:MBL fold metallo-hydrolase [Usitatibacteraceae bacterium]
MRVRFWGTRGSLPVALTPIDIREKIAQALLHASGREFADLNAALAYARNALPFSVNGTFGGHTPCVEIDTGGEEFVVCDFGSGARPFGAHVLARQTGRPVTIHALMSHLHWDHIMGFPFFGPAYVPRATIRIYGCHAELEHAFRLQQSPPCFPVEFDQLRARIEFIRLVPGVRCQVGPVAVTPELQLHGGDSYGYRIEHAGKSIVYSTDSEHKPEDAAQTGRVTAFFRDADLVVFDAMYALADAISVKEDWGHSSNIVGVELAQRARVKHLVLFHHEPANSDATLERLLTDTRRFEELTHQGHRVEISSAYDGLEIDV